MEREERESTREEKESGENSSTRVLVDGERKKKRERGEGNHLKLLLFHDLRPNTLFCMILCPHGSTACGFRTDEAELAKPFERS